MVEPMTLQLGQPVTTPNGPGIYQYPLWSDGDIYHMVSHPVTAQIDESKCRAHFGNGKGIWHLCGYDKTQIEEATR